MRLRLAVLATVVVVVDQLTKLAVVRSLEIGESRRVLDGVLWITHVRNTGAAFGVLRGMSGLLALAAILGVVVFAGIIVRRPPPLVGVGAALIAGGAFGNLLDRAFRPWPFAGSVVDFFDLRYWPAFNVADAAITVGAVTIVLSGFLREERGRATDTTEDGAAADRGR